MVPHDRFFVYSWFYTGYDVYGNCLDADGAYRLLKVRGFYPSCYVEGDTMPASTVVPVRVEHRWMTSSRNVSSSSAYNHVFFANLKDMNIFVSEVKNRRSYMADIKPITVFLSQTDLDYVGWVDVAYKSSDTGNTTICVDIGNVTSSKSTKNKKGFLPYSHPKVMAFDIEVRTSDSGMPKPYRILDTVEIISAVVFDNLRSDTTKTFIIHAYDRPMCIKDAKDIICNDEADIIVKFFELIKQEDPTVITGFNIYGFDLHYLVSRLQLRLLVIPDVSRGFSSSVDLIKVDWKSDAYGHNNYNRLVIGGRVIIDMYLYFKRMKLDKYSLEFISNKFLGEGKSDMSHKRMMKAFTSGDPDALREVAEYCIRDSALVMRLFEKVQMWIDACEVSKITKCGIEDIYTRGEQMKLVSQCVKECMIRNIVLQPQQSSEWKQYEGAYVLEPEKGVYEGCSVVDFQSLYPSIIIAYNICPSTYVKHGNRNLHFAIPSSFTHPENIVPPGHISCPDARHYFRKNPIGLLPGMIKKILYERKSVKAQMASYDKASIDYIVLDRRQNALKICANSVYGMMGFKNSKYFGNLGCAESVTTVGRMLLSNVVEKIELAYPVKVIYGDSVTGYTPTILRIQKQFVFIETLENIAARWGRGSSWIECLYSDKESCDLYDVEVWTEDSWTRCHRVIRHVLAPHKKIIRVLTHTGLVDVTDEHSLLDADGVLVDAKNVEVGDRLLHHPYPRLKKFVSISPKEARILGMFCGCGTQSGKQISWAINNSDGFMLLKYKKLCKEIYSQYAWVILDTMNSDMRVYKLLPKGQGVNILSRRYRYMVYKENEIIVPHEIMNSDSKTRQAFWDGLCDAEKTRLQCGARNPTSGQKEVRIDQKHQLTIASFAMLASSLGYSISFDTIEDEQNIFRLIVTKKSEGFFDSARARCAAETAHHRYTNAIKKKYYIEYAGYVYDLTTDNHRFQAGPGNMIVHNTDSCMLWHKGSSETEKNIELGMSICDDITAALPEPMALNFESYCEKIILLTKKRYVLVSSGKVFYKGVMNARRDYCKYAKDTYSGVMEMVAKGRSNEDIARYVDDKILALLCNRYSDVSDLVVTKSIGKSLNAYKVAQPHIVLAKRLVEKTGMSIQVGTRLEYIFTKKNSNITAEGTKEEKNAEKNGRLRTPEEVKNEGLEIDGMFYVKKQLATQIDDVLSAIGMSNYIKNTWLS